MQTPKRSAWLLVAFAASGLACGSTDAGGDCAPGSEVCECYANRTCDAGLICSGSDICVEDDAGSGGTDDSDNGGSGGSGGSSDAGGSGGSDGGSSNVGGTGASGDSGGSDTSGSGGSSGDSGDSGGASSDAGGASTTGEDSTNSAGGATSGTDGGAGGTAGVGGNSGGMGGSTATASGGAGGTTSTTTTSSSTTSGGGTTGETRTALVPVDGWVDGSTNDVGIQGSWYTYSDEGATVVPADEPFFDGAGSEICISGTTVPDEYSGVYWGVAVGMDFNVVDETTYAYDATSHGVVGIRLTLTGSLPPGIQLNLTETTSVEGDVFCTRYLGITESSRTLSLYFDEAQFICWYDATFGPIDETLLRAFSVQVMSEAYQSVPFDFCVENVSAILE